MTENAETSPTPTNTGLDPIYVIGTRAAALLSLAALAPGLSEAELRTAVYLASIEDPGHHTAIASSRQIAEKTRLERKNVRRALDSLDRRHLIATRQGTATRAAAYLLNFTQTAAFRGGLSATPPPAQMVIGGVTVTPPQAQGGVQATPPLPLFPDGVGSQQPHPSEPVSPVDISIEPISIIDRMLNSRPSHFDKTTLAEVGAWLHGYMTKFGDIPNPHPPDPYILAQFLAISDWENLKGLLRNLMAERKRPGQSYAWFATVALQRIHGVQPQVLKARRADLRIARRPQAPEPTQDNLEFAENLVADLAKAKGMAGR